MKPTRKGLITLLSLSAVAVLAACGGGNASSSQSSKELTATEKVVAEAQTLTRQELYKKAAAELGTKTFHWLATSSRGGKVADKFVAALNDAASTSISVDQIDYQTVVDGVIYTTLNAEIDAGKPTFSGALLQDGYQLATKGLTKNYVNYVPKEWSEKSGVNKDRDASPFSLQFQFKTWMYNNHNDDMEIDNVWDFAKDGLKIDTMDPRNENVNMDWLIQLTSDDNCAVLKQAFEDRTNSSGLTSSDLEKYKEYGESRAYAFLFMEKFIKNAVFYADDGKAMSALAETPGHAGWIVYSKIMKVEESEQVTKKDIVIGALGENHSDGANPTLAMKGFGGFMYKHYLMVMPDSPLPYTACAFINFLSTTETGYSKWAGDVGDYPTYGEDINQNRTKLGYVDGENAFPCLNDPTANWWIDAAKAPVETPSYIGEYYPTVKTFIDAQIAAK